MLGADFDFSLGVQSPPSSVPLLTVVPLTCALSFLLRETLEYVQTVCMREGLKPSATSGQGEHAFSCVFSPTKQHQLSVS